MKTTIEEKKKNIFPCLKRNKKEGFVVLFINESAGTVIYSDEKTTNYNFGYYSASWISCFKDGEWDDFNGKVTIEN